MPKRSTINTTRLGFQVLIKHYLEYFQRKESCSADTWGHVGRGLYHSVKIPFSQRRAYLVECEVRQKRVLAYQLLSKLAYLMVLFFNAKKVSSQAIIEAQLIPLIQG